MEKKKQELMTRFDMAKDTFVCNVREETIKAGIELPPELIEYLYKKLEPVLDDLANELIDKAEPWLRSRYRKFKIWLRRRF